MASRVKQLLVYARLSFILLVLLGAALMVLMNRNYKTNFWPGASGDQVPTLWLMLASAVGAVVVFWTVSKTRRVLKDLSEVRAEAAQQARVSASEKLRQSLAEQERRIDEKLRSGLQDKETPEA